MKAAVLFEVGRPLEIVDVELAPPKSNEVRVRMLAAGICQSDWHCINGDWPMPLPFLAGHEGAGVVEEVGDGVAGLSVDDLVILTFTPNCGRCPSCINGRSVLCTGYASVPPGLMQDGTARMRFRGEPIYQMARVGCFAEKIIVAQNQLVKIRKDMPPAQAALVSCSVTTGIGAVTRHAKIEFGSTVAVVGCGGVGLNVIQAAKVVGASSIVAIDVNSRKLEYASKFGATHVILSGQDGSAEQVHSAVVGGVDYCFDTVCVGSTMSLALSAVRPGGRVVAVGIPADKETASFHPRALVTREKTISGTLFGSSRPAVDFPAIVEQYLAGHIDIDSLISKTYDIEDINAAFAAMMRGEAARGVVLFRQ